MKKFIFSLLFAVTTLTSLAQTDSEHLLFKSVPINGTLNEYVSKMKSAGFSYLGTKDGMVQLNGDFAIYKNCIIGVATLKQKDLVSNITVKFPDRDTWSDLTDNYFSLKKMLTEKYGEPSVCIEEFQCHSEPKEDSSKLLFVKLDNCKYITTYSTAKGDIQLSIGHKDITSCFILLTYFDKINTDSVKAKAMDDL